MTDTITWVVRNARDCRRVVAVRRRYRRLEKRGKTASPCYERSVDPLEHLDARSRWIVPAVFVYVIFQKSKT